MPPFDALPTDFAETGIAIHLKPATTLTRFQVIGERASGTNLTNRLLGRNSPMKSSDVLGWKHGFPHAMAIPDDLVVVGLVRDATSWVRSLHAKPWHSTPDIQRLTFSEFLRTPWHSEIDREDYFKNSGPLGVVGQTLQHDRHPLTGRPFETVFDMRTAKLQALLSYFERNCNFILIRAEVVQADPMAATHALLDALSFARPDMFRGVHRRVGSKFKSRVGPRPPTPEILSQPDLEFLRARLDCALERRLGYDY
ncbi:hypothetical protein K3727_13775 [Rhodobacteraceae bacterium M382]|nr:hypothetical protein K3727_13775 [Rhodobacteraceae bacterium M382]